MFARRFWIHAAVILFAACAAASAGQMTQVRSSGYWGPVPYCHHSLTQDGDKATAWGTNASPPNVWIEFEFNSPTEIGSLILYAAPMRLAGNQTANNITSISVLADGQTVLTQALSWPSGLAPSLVVNLPAGTTAQVLRIQALTCAYTDRMMGFSEAMLLPPGATSEGERYPYSDSVVRGVQSRQAYYTSQKQQTSAILAQLRNEHPLATDPRFSSQVTQTAENVTLTRQMTEMILSKNNGCITSVKMLDRAFTNPGCLLGNLVVTQTDGSNVQQKDVTGASALVTDGPTTVTMTAQFTLSGNIPFEETYTYYKSSGVMFLKYRYTGASARQIRRLAVQNRITDSTLIYLFKEGDGPPSFQTAILAPVAHWVTRDHGFQVGVTDWRDAKGSFSGDPGVIVTGQSGDEKRLDTCFVSQMSGTAVTMNPGDEYGMYVCMFPTKQPKYEPIVLQNDLAMDYEYVNWNWTSDVENFVTGIGDWFSRATFSHWSWMSNPWSPVAHSGEIKILTNFAKSKGMNVCLYNDMRWGSTSDQCYNGMVTYEDVKDATPVDFGLSLGSPGWRLGLLNAYRMALTENQDPDVFYLDSINMTADLGEVGLANVEGIQLFLEDLRLLVNNYPVPKKRAIIAHNLAQHPAPTAALADYFLPGEHIWKTNTEELSQQMIDTVYNQYMDGCGIVAHDDNSYKLDSGKFYLGFMRYPQNTHFPCYPFVSPARASFADINLTSAERIMFNRFLRPVFDVVIDKEVNVVHPLDRDYASHIMVVSGNPWVTAYEVKGRTVLVVTTQPGQYQTSGIIRYKCPGLSGTAKVSNAIGMQPVQGGWVDINYNVNMEPQIISVVYSPCWNAADDFSLSENPSGPWCYGYVPTDQPLGNFYPYTTQYSAASPNQCDGWGDWNGGAITRNVSGNDIWLWFGYWVRNGGMFTFPGLGTRASMRWTSPIAGKVTIDARFNGCANSNMTSTTSDVYVLLNGTTLWNRTVNGSIAGGGAAGMGTAPTQSYMGSVDVNTGDRVDFVIGPGSDGRDTDRVDLDATISVDDGVPPAGQTWSLPADFSAATHPDGSWDYGYVPGSQPLGDFHPHGPVKYSAAFANQCDGWGDWSLGAITKNVSGNDIWLWFGYWDRKDGMFIFPGPGTRASTRWTSPLNGPVSIAAMFMGCANNIGSSTTSDVHVLLNGSSLWDGYVNGAIAGGGASGIGPASTQDYSGFANVEVGDTIDFVIGLGSDGSRETDRLDLDATITSYGVTPCENIAGLKYLADGTWVGIALPNVVTVATGTFADGSLYIEDPNRAMGIKVVPLPGVPALALGERITLMGIMGTDGNAQRVINLSTVTGRVLGDQLGAIGMLNRTITGGPPSVTGLLVRAWGAVSYRAPDGTYVYVDDGSGVTDGSGHAGIRVILTGLSAGNLSVPQDWCVVTGLAGLANIGAGASVPVVRPRSQADIQTF